MVTDATPSREALIAAAAEIHDGRCGCDRKYRMSCPDMANAILEAGKRLREAAATPGPALRREVLFPCCRHCIDGDGMLPCGEFHPEPCGTGDCGLVTDAELAEWRKGLQL